MTFAGLASTETGAVKNYDPLLSDPINNDFTVPSNSPAVDAGGHLTTVAAGDTSSGTSLILTNAEFFQDGWAGVDADWICVGATVAAADCFQITSINYGTNTLTVADFTRADGEYVWLYKDSDGTIVLRGSAPDIGAEEYNPTPTSNALGVTMSGCYPN